MAHSDNDTAFDRPIHSNPPCKVEERRVSYWPIGSAFENPPADAGLCSVCSQIDFRFFLRNPVWSQYDEPQVTRLQQELPLRWLWNISREEKCKFCRLVWIAIQSQYSRRIDLGDVWKTGRLDKEPVSCDLNNQTDFVSDELGTFYVEGHDDETKYWRIRQTGEASFERRRVDAGDVPVGLDSRRYYFEISTTPDIGITLSGPDSQEKVKYGFTVPTNVRNPRIQMVQQSSTNKLGSIHSGGRLMAHPHTDFELLKRWVNMCEHGHSDQSARSSTSTSTPPLRNFRLIDVEERRLVYLDKPSRYIALSYVWGMDQPVKLLKSTKSVLESPGGFDRCGQLPHTIVDVMDLVKQLGERYVWIDALCIIQDDGKDKAALIQNMDLIYSLACLTIVAAGGIDANAGLPGVRPRDKNYQHIEEVQGLKLANMLPVWEEVVGTSKWNSRAWTYQERMLSQRTLVFSDEQAHYRCAFGCNFREDTVTDSELRLLKGQANTSLDLGELRPLMDYEEETNWEAYARLVTEYSSRQMTNPIDHLNAFTSIENVISPLFRCGPEGFLGGLPPAIFDAALLWMPRGRSIRRKNLETGEEIGFSWSWSGWEGIVDYEPLLNRCETTVSMLRFSSSESGQIEPDPNVTPASQFQPPDLVSLTAVLENKKWVRQYDDESGGIYYTDTQQDQDVRFACPVITDDPENPQLGILQTLAASSKDDSFPGLRLRALIARFNLDGNHTRGVILPGTSSVKCTPDEHVVCGLSVFDRECYIAGTVYVDAEIAQSLPPGTYEFLALSRTTLYQNDMDISWEEESKCFLSSPDQRPEGSVDEDDSDSDSFDELDELVRGTISPPCRRGFDSTRYDKKLYWPLCNVLLIERRDEAVHRIGIGKIHIDAFSSVCEEQHILLR